jgi:type II secretory pathway pseudopilin PulG
MKIRNDGHTLIELIVIVMILGALAFVAVPRLSYAVLYRKQVDAVARKVVADLRRARRLAISDAATNTDGFALNRSGATFQIEDLSDSTIVQNSTFTLDATISCSGGTSFQFGPLGNLKAGAGTQLVLSSSGKSFTIDVLPATGTIKCTPN